MNSSEQSEEELFLKCLELPTEEREAFLESTCQGNSELCDNVLSLLRSHESAEGFMNSLPEEDSAAVASRLQRIAPSDECSGDQIGRYRVVEKIGEGAWGAVWLAEQTEDINREVALKILKLGLDTKDFLIRFEAERQMLAMMDHPNIATIYDAGATDFGRPYLVMELVQGKPLIEYSDDNQLSVEERVELFIKVCQALEHAHQKGVIHRDIKPSNILVTLQDDGPVPKVIDFGVAKTNQFRLGDRTLFTSIHTFIGTPLYSSPEQLEYSGKDVDERSDVYSLGALLYEYLSGLTPFDHERVSEMGLEGLRTIIRETDPPRPSLRFANQESEEQERISNLRATASVKLERQLKGDLDWVIMKCLEKDRDRRYNSANALGEDLRAFLDLRPVSAAAPSMLYRTRKFIRRNHLAPFVWAVIPAALLCLFAFVFFIRVRNTTPIEFTSPFSIPLSENNRSLAVLPFENLSENEEDAFLADSIHNELTSVLSRIQDIKTIPRNSTIRYKDTNKPGRIIAEELDVVNLLTGAVQRLDQSIRIQVRLIDAVDDRNLWSEIYTREFTPNNLFKIQSEICTAIARELSAVLTPEEDRSIAKVPTQSLEALASYLKAKEIVLINKKYTMPEAIALFEKAIELDPNFALAYVGLAESYLQFSSEPTEGGLNQEEQNRQSEERQEKLFAAAKKAFELDERLPEVQVLQGKIKLIEKDYDGAKAAFERVIKLFPHVAEGYWGLANWYKVMDRPDKLLNSERLDDSAYIASMEEGLTLYAKATELDPSNPNYRSAYAFWLGDMLRFEESLEQFRLAVFHNSEHPGSNYNYGTELISQWSRFEEGMLYLRKALALDPNDGSCNLTIAEVFEDLGDFEQAERWTLRHIAQSKRMDPLYQAHLQRFRGEDELALKTYREILASTRDGLSNADANSFVLSNDLRTACYLEARARYLAAAPQLFEPEIEVVKSKYPTWAMELATVLVGTGELEHAQKLADFSRKHMKRSPDGFTAQFHDIQYHFLKGDQERALKVLQEAVEAGYRDRRELGDARLDSFRSHPEFIVMMEFVEADMSQQLANIRRMEANGEFEAVPKL